MSGGLIFVERGILDHPLFKREPFTEREAWLWMLFEAAWKPRRVPTKKGIIALSRGQLTASTRFMAERWRWSEARVRRYLIRLKTDAMIDAASDAAQMVLTIRNYDKYQRVGGYRDAAGDAENGGQATQDRRSTDANKKTRENQRKPENPAAPVGADADADADDDPVAITFRRGRRLLARHGVPARRQGAIIGRWRKLVGGDDALLGRILDHACEEPRGEVVAYVEGTIRARTRPPDPERSRRIVERMHQLIPLGIGEDEACRLPLGDMSEAAFQKLVAERRARKEG